MNIAIVVVAYNRVDSVARLLSSLEKAYFNHGDVTLIISVDKSNTDIVEKYAENYNWPHGEKIVDKHETNFGLRKHMLSLGKWFEKVDAIVVLEDDIVVSPNFFSYTWQTVEKYYDCPDIAGISLYSLSVNYQTAALFSPEKDEHDVYFMNCAMSWGEVWMKESWMKFHDWYIHHQDFPLLPHLPKSVCKWSNKSWLKYHIRYCIEENKFFVHPYVSLTTNYGDKGVHFTGGGDTVNQVSLQKGNKTFYSLPDFGADAVYYNGFMENKKLYKTLGLGEEELCVDLQGGNNNQLNKKYWLTTEVKNYKIIKSYGLNYRPIEENIILENPGEDIFLYDTTIYDKNANKGTHKTRLFQFHLSNIVIFVLQYGIKNTWRDFCEYLFGKVKK